MSNKFKVGDRVHHIQSPDVIGVVKEVLHSEQYRVDWGVHGLVDWGVHGLFDYPLKYLELVESVPVYEEGWTLNDGKVEIPDDAKLAHCDDGSEVVAFKRRIKPRVRYINIYDSETHGIYVGVGSKHPSREQADKRASKGRIACVKITEGQFDD